DLEWGPEAAPTRWPGQRGGAEYTQEHPPVNVHGASPPPAGPLGPDGRRNGWRERRERSTDVHPTEPRGDPDARRPSSSSLRAHQGLVRRDRGRSAVFASGSPPPRGWSPRSIRPRPPPA